MSYEQTLITRFFNVAVNQAGEGEVSNTVIAIL